MLTTLLILASARAEPAEFRPLEVRFPFPNMAVVRLQEREGEAKWMLLDSGFPRTFVKGAKPGGAALGFPYAEGIWVDFAVGPPPKGFDVGNLDLLKADGILGVDGMARLSWFLDYRKGTVAARLPGPVSGEAALAQALRLSGRKEEAIATLPMLRDNERWYRVTASLGDGAPKRWVLDTGTSTAFAPVDPAELGPPIVVRPVSTPNGIGRSPIHLGALRLAGLPALPMLVGASGRDEPPVLGLFALSSDWALFDPVNGVARVPRPTPAEFAARWAQLLAPGDRRATPSQLATLANVATPAALRRAREVASALTEEPRKDRR